MEAALHLMASTASSYGVFLSGNSTEEDIARKLRQMKDWSHPSITDVARLARTEPLGQQSEGMRRHRCDCYLHTVARTRTQWSRLLHAIAKGVVIPFAGRDLIPIEVDASEQLLYEYLATQPAAARLS
jgi:hypothetical protein